MSPVVEDSLRILLGALLIRGEFLSQVVVYDLLNRMYTNN